MTMNPFRSVASVPVKPAKLRRSCLAVPGSNKKMMAAAATSDTHFLT